MDTENAFIARLKEASERRGNAYLLQVDDAADALDELLAGRRLRSRSLENLRETLAAYQADGAFLRAETLSCIYWMAYESWIIESSLRDAEESAEEAKGLLSSIKRHF